jgi:hypothetical protein
MLGGLRAASRLLHLLVPLSLDRPFEPIDEPVGRGLERLGRLAAVEIRALHVELRLDDVVVDDPRVPLPVEEIEQALRTGD